jgi:hypothetical protein
MKNKVKLCESIEVDIKIVLVIAIFLFIWQFIPICVAISQENGYKEIGYNMSPLFIENANTIWAVQQTTSRRKVVYSVVFSDNYGDSWVKFVQLPSTVNKIPRSIFIHPTGHIFIAEDVPIDRSARVYRIDRQTKAITIARYLDPTATIAPWGWACDADGNLYAGQYGFGSLSGAPEGYGPNTKVINISYILKIADIQGNSISRSAEGSVSNWYWPPDVVPELNFATWVAPRGVAADLHIHNVRFDLTRNLFFINAGDNPRSFMYWEGDTETPPVLADRTYEQGILGGFTGCAPLIDGIYVGDDWTVAGRGNSIRKYQLSNERLSYMGLVQTLPNEYDTPIFDLHATIDEKNLYFVNYDEPREGEPPIRLSGIHKLSRSNTTQSFFNFTTLGYSQSSWRNWHYIAANLNGQVPNDMPYIFIWGEGTYNGAPITVIARVIK